MFFFFALAWLNLYAGPSVISLPDEPPSVRWGSCHFSFSISAAILYVASLFVVQMFSQLSVLIQEELFSI